MAVSTLEMTNHTKGTRLYCAPEMFPQVSSSSQSQSGKAEVAKASRKTDMYAFALVCWQVLSGRRPFAEVANDEAALVIKVRTLSLELTLILSLSPYPYPLH